MNLDNLTVNVRPLHSFQAMDLGLMMARQWFKPLWGLWCRRMLPALLLVVGFYLVKWLLPDSISLSWAWLWLLLWWLKPYAEVPLVLYLSQKLFDSEFGIDDTWQQVKQLSAKDSLLLLTRYRFSFRRQLLMPILILERQTQQQMRQRLQVLSQSQNNAITWHSMGFNLIETLLYMGLLALAMQLVPQSLLEDLPWFDWFGHTPLLIEVLLLGLYVLVISVLSVFYVASGFAVYICKRSLLEGWDIELKFRKLAQRHAQQRASL
ncbi:MULTISPECIES: hypothetical protein [unclassified Moraxella]|uniref:hypothetical protein n=1 Tax=unclassified Moraxella TaxID=2685852 RepID=UPI003AF58C47